MSSIIGREMLRSRGPDGNGWGRRGRDDALSADGPLVILRGHRGGVAVADDAAFVDPDGAAAVVADLWEGVGDEEDGLSGSAEAFHSLEALQLKSLVADGEGLVDQEDVGVDVGRDGEGK